MLTRAPCKEDEIGILCLTYQCNCKAHSRIKPQPVHLHCKNFILCYTFILATDPGTTTHPVVFPWYWYNLFHILWEIPMRDAPLFPPFSFQMSTHCPVHSGDVWPQSSCTSRMLRQSWRQCCSYLPFQL